MKDLLKNLLETVSYQTRKTTAEISLDMGYKKNYISEILSPTGVVTTKFMNAFKAKYKDILENRSDNPIIVKDSAAMIINNQVELLAAARVMLSIIAEIQAPQLKRLPSELTGIYRRMVKDEVEQVREELKRQKL